MKNENINTYNSQQEELVRIAKEKLSEHPDIQKLREFAIAVNKYTGEDIFLVWGTIRNVLLNLPINDFDITWPLFTEDILRVIDIANNSNPEEGCLYYGKTVQEALGILSIYMEWAQIGWHQNPMQYAQFRIENEYDTVSTPSHVKLWVSLEEDAIRRDCTINSIYYNIRTNTLIDPQWGIKDLFSGVIANNNLEGNVFKNDPLRIFRVVRMQAMLKEHNLDKDIVIEAGTLEAMKCALDDINKLPLARIVDELIKWAKYKHFFRLLSDYHILGYIHENFELARGLDQKTKYHKYDTLEHILRTAEAGYDFYPNENPGFYLWLLFHDIGKPTQFLAQRQFEPKSKDFYLAKELNAHEKVGGEIVRKIFQYTPKDISNIIFSIVERHQDKLLYINDDMFNFLLKSDEDEDNLTKAEVKYLPLMEETIGQICKYVKQPSVNNIKGIWTYLLKAHYCDKVGSGLFEDREILDKQNMFLEDMFHKFYEKREINNYRINSYTKEKIEKELIPTYSTTIKNAFYKKIEQAIFTKKITKDFDSIAKFFRQMAWFKNPVLSIIPTFYNAAKRDTFIQAVEGLNNEGDKWKGIERVYIHKLPVMQFVVQSLQKKSKVELLFNEETLLKDYLIGNNLPIDLIGIDLDRKAIIKEPAQNKWFILFRETSIFFSLQDMKDLDLLLEYLNHSVNILNT